MCFPSIHLALFQESRRWVIIIRMSAFYEVMKLVEGWQPEAFPTELKYRDSLAALLRAQLEGTIETEYRHAGTTIDVYVKQAGFWKPSKVYIELKRNLLHKA